MALPIRGSQQQPQHFPMVHPIELMHREFDDLLSRFFGGGVGPLTTNALPASFGTMAAFGKGYAVDVREDDKHVYVDADLPGFEKGDIDISIDERVLTISAEHHEETTEPQQAAQQGQQQGQQKQAKQQQQAGREEEKKGQYLLRERHFERFTRSFTLPQNVDEQNVQAKLEKGVLKITLNKRQESKPKKIQVS